MADSTELLQSLLGVRPESATEATLRLLIWTGCQILGAEEGSLLVVDDATEDLRFVMTLGNDESERTLIGQRVPLGSGITGLAAATREVQIGSPVFRDLKGLDKVDGAAPEAVIAAPMLIDDRVIGVITGVSFVPGKRFSGQDGRIFGGFAVIAGVLVDQERRVSAMSRRAEPRWAGETEVMERLAALAGRRPEAMADVVAMLMLAEKLALSRP